MLLALLPSQAPVYDYAVMNLEGWIVHVERKIITTRPKLWTAARNELTCQLMRIERSVPDGPLAKIKTVPLWIHLNNPSNPGAAYHPSRKWLEEHNQDPDMARGIEFGNAENLVSWPYHQPWMAFHEMAHAYHDQFLPKGWQNEQILAAFNGATASHKYDSILCEDGGTRKAYALTNQMEYFAETSEAYIGQNDGFPFIRAELKTFDPAGYEAARMAWGDPVIKVPVG